MDIEKILNVSDVADILQVKPITVREMFREKRLRAFKVGKGWRTTRRMLEEDIEALSRGEAPPALPDRPANLPKRDEESEETASGTPPEPPAPKPVQPEARVAPPVPAPPAPTPPPAPAPEATASEEAAPKPPRKPRKPANGDDDSQGLLF